MFTYDNRMLFGTFSCDECGHTDEYGGTFKECVDQAKEDNWGFEFDEDLKEWYHACPTCG